MYYISSRSTQYDDQEAWVPPLSTNPFDTYLTYGTSSAALVPPPRASSATLVPHEFHEFSSCRLVCVQTGMVEDMVKILNLQQRFAPRYTAMRLALAKRQSAAAAAASAGSSVTAAGGVAAASEESSDDGGGSPEDGDDRDDAAEVDDARVMDQGAAVVAPAEGGGSGGSPTENSGSEANNNAAGSAEEAARVGQAAASAAASSAAQVAAVRLRKRLREEMSPTTDVAVWSRVRQELDLRGGFQPLMPLFPGVKRGVGAAGVSAVAAAAARGIHWGERDFEMPTLMGKMARIAKRAPSVSASVSP